MQKVSNFRESIGNFHKIGHLITSDFYITAGEQMMKKQCFQNGRNYF